MLFEGLIPCRSLLPHKSGNTDIHVVCIVGDTVIHVVCIARYSYTCSMYCGDKVIHVICIVGYSYTCSMYCGIQLCI